MDNLDSSSERSLNQEHLKARIALIRESFAASKAAHQLVGLGITPTNPDVIEGQIIDVQPSINQKTEPASILGRRQP